MPGRARHQPYGPGRVRRRIPRQGGAVTKAGLLGEEITPLTVPGCRGDDGHGPARSRVRVTAYGGSRRDRSPVSVVQLKKFAAGHEGSVNGLPEPAGPPQPAVSA
jgi:hypothetical protein